MGLDMYIFECRKPMLKKTRYTAEELMQLGFNYCTLSEFAERGSAVSELLPCMSRVFVESNYYNLDQMIADYKMPSDTYIGMITGGGIGLCGTTSNGDSVVQNVSMSEVEEKYLIPKLEESYVWDAKQVAYWRKAYKEQGALHGILRRPVENCGYYRLTAEDMAEFISNFPDDPNRSSLYGASERALYYHEWY